MRELIKKGLVQIPDDGLTNLIKWIDDGKELIFDGKLISDTGVP